MDSSDLQPQLEELEGNIDDLEEVLAPILKAPLSDSASKLPVLDKAKLYVFATYSIESLLFSYLRLAGTNAKEHPVYEELNRVKAYFAKIKTAETPPAEKNPNMSLDKDAAGRIVKHGLSGNEKYDQERALRQAKERAAAQLKLKRLSSQNQPNQQNQQSDSPAKPLKKGRKRKSRHLDQNGAEGEKRSAKPNTGSSPALTEATIPRLTFAELTEAAKRTHKKRKTEAEHDGKQQNQQPDQSTGDSSSSVPQSSSACSNVEETSIPQKSDLQHKASNAASQTVPQSSSPQSQQLGYQQQQRKPQPQQQPGYGAKKSGKKKKNKHWIPRNQS